jgi:N-acyl-D-amino-acid deacylase
VGATRRFALPGFIDTHVHASGAVDDELATGMVESGLADRAAVLPSGLECIPGRYVDAAELAGLCVPLAGAELTVLADGALTTEGRDAGRALRP